MFKGRMGLPIGALLALIWVFGMCVIAIFADVLAPHPPTAIDLSNRLARPYLLGGSSQHLLGTDELGRDVLARVIFSVRISLTLAFGATLIATIVGIFVGFLAAHFRGYTEHAVLAAIDFQASMPFLIVALAVLAFVGAKLWILILLLALHSWEKHARLARGLALSAGVQGYSDAVRQLGAGPARVYLLHILPNIIPSLIVSATIAFPEVILLESGLSFLGLGVQPPMTSLGNLVGYGRNYLLRAPWLVLAPSMVIVLTTISISILGDWLRERLDPTIRSD